MKKVKCILLGNTSVGKTSFLGALNEQMNEGTQSTIGVNYSTFICNDSLMLEIYDTAGQEKFRSLTDLYYRDSQIVVFMTTCLEDTIKSDDESLEYFIETAYDKATQFTPIFILNKIDLMDAEKLAKRKQNVTDLILRLHPELKDSLIFLEISCIECTGIDLAKGILISTAENIIETLQPPQPPQPIEENDQDNKSNIFKEKCNC